MAKHGFLIMDSEMHVMEPPDLWQRYMPLELRSQSPDRADVGERARLENPFPQRLAPGWPGQVIIRGLRRFTE